MKTVNLISEYSRRFPDPINNIATDPPMNIEHHVLLCPAVKLSNDIPDDPNPREQNIDRALYKEVKESLLNESDPTFHLKNKGITIIAHSVSYSDDKKIINVTFKEGDGIVDGGHTYEIIKQNQEECPETQFVKIEILTGISMNLLEPIAQGLNTAIQVQEMSLSNLGHKFDWIKEALIDEPYANQIAYRENEEGAFDARDIVAFMTLFNIGIDDFKEKTLGGTRHPKEAYTNKANCLKSYKRHTESYEKLRPILKDILQLHDIINLEGINLYNKKYQGKGGKLAFYKSRKRGKYSFPFTGGESKFQLHEGALMPLMGAFRFLVKEDSDGNFTWKPGSFDEVLEIWRKIGADMINSTKITSESRDRNPNAIGKDEGHWDSLYKTVGMEYLQGQI
ncbi:MAG: AIPR family protein [Phycisphaerae bacterium]|nr:AIPR family protein [Phycisphaerae bacterium]